MKAILLASLLASSALFHPMGERSVICPPAAPAAEFVADSTLPSYKSAAVREVFNRLKNAKGDHRSRRPFLRFVKSSGGGPAVAYPKSGTILFEEKAYDICAGFGKDSLNALANILAHELVHCYEKHDWEEFFAHDFSDKKVGGMVNDDAKEDEIQADYLGGFLAYQAGFSTAGIASKFIDKVYEKYGLTDELLSNYPPKAERKGMAAKSAEKLKSLLDLFDMGNYLAALGEYPDALEYYLKVLEDFQSREVYNNVGVLSTLSAMRLFGQSENRFAYPVELDAQSRMRVGSRGTGTDSLREALLGEAIDYFEKARQFDAFYPIAHLNEGCAHALLGLAQKEFRELEWEDSEVAARRALRLCADQKEWQHTQADAHVLLGILSAVKKDSVQSEGHLADALSIENSNFLALANRDALRGIKPVFKPVLEIDLSAETVDGLAIKDLRLDATNVRGKLVDAPDRVVTLAAKEFSTSKAFANSAVTGTGGQKFKKNTFLLMTADGYAQPTAKGIKIGSPLADVLEKYGEPQARVNLGGGSMLRYKNSGDFSGMVFQLSNAGKVERWAVYRQMR